MNLDLFGSINIKKELENAVESLTPGVHVQCCN